MVPRKDYDDYSRYINDSYLSRKDLVREGIEKTAAAHHCKIQSQAMQAYSQPSRRFSTIIISALMATVAGLHTAAHSSHLCGTVSIDSNRQCQHNTFSCSEGG